jgi:glycosyltransferase involved in cell wall biosynthesis
MIAYCFPPEGNAATYRPLRFVRHLRDVGWEPAIITLKTTFYERYDPELLSILPSAIQVVRVHSRDPWQAIQTWRAQRIQENIAPLPSDGAASIFAAQRTPVRSFIRKTTRKLEACCYHPDLAMGWIRPAVRATLRLCSTMRPDVIWATAGPVSSFVVAQRASRYTGLPYILDFRDPWTITCTEFEALRPEWAKRLDRYRMYKLLEGARAVVVRSAAEAECYYRFYKGALNSSQIHIIPNGFEGKIDKFLMPNGDRCKVLYTGNVSDYRYDTLLQALYLLKQSSPEEARQLSLIFVGEGSDVLAEKAASLGVADLIERSGPIGHAEVARLSRAAHALLVFGRPATLKGYELLAGAKLFAYLKSGLPIIGVLPSDETRNILKQVGVSTIADVDSVPGIVAMLRQVLNAWSKGDLSSFCPTPIACEIYSAERQTAALVRAFEGRPAAETFVPGSVEIPESLREDLLERGSTTSDYCTAF